MSNTTAPEPVISGVPYPVTEVGGTRARDLADFVGTVEIRIDKQGVPYVINGEGHSREDAVRVHEKNGPGGKDVRVWRIFRGEDESFLAETSV